MNLFALPRVASLGALGLTLALSHAAALAQGTPNANATAGLNNGNATSAAPKPINNALLPNMPAAANANENALNRFPYKNPPKALFNEDGTPANDAALSIRPDPPVQLPPKAANRHIARHVVIRGPVDLTKSTTQSRPQHEITIKR